MTKSTGTDAGVREIAATQITLGAGLVDITEIKHEGRVGVLFRPRQEHVPFGGPGVLPEGTYWPVAGDVVLWVTGDGPGVAIDALAALSLAPAARAGDGVEAIRDVLKEALAAVEAPWSGYSSFPVSIDSEDRDRLIAMAKILRKARPLLAAAPAANGEGAE